MLPTSTLATFPQATHFARNPRSFRADIPLTDDQMHAVAPSIFAKGKHASRSERYTHIPTNEVLRRLRKEGFQPFMVAQSASRSEGRAAFTQHLIRLRHAAEVQRWPEVNEIVLINRCYGG